MLWMRQPWGARGSTTGVPLEFCLLQGEIAEAFDAWRKGRETVGEELADVAIYLLGLAEMTGIDLQNEIEAKIAKNAARVYQRLPNGVLAKSSGDPGWRPRPWSPASWSAGRFRRTRRGHPLIH